MVYSQRSFASSGVVELLIHSDSTDPPEGKERSLLLSDCKQQSARLVSGEYQVRIQQIVKSGTTNPYEKHCKD